MIAETPRGAFPPQKFPPRVREKVPAKRKTRTDDYLEELLIIIGLLAIGVSAITAGGPPAGGGFLQRDVIGPTPLPTLLPASQALLRNPNAAAPRQARGVLYKQNPKSGRISRRRRANSQVAAARRARRSN